MFNDQETNAFITDISGHPQEAETCPQLELAVLCTTEFVFG